MLTIWVKKIELDSFVEQVNGIYSVDTLSVNYYTYQPNNKTEYVQLQINYDEYLQLEEKNTFTKK